MVDDAPKVDAPEVMPSEVANMIATAREGLRDYLLAGLPSPWASDRAYEIGRLAEAVHRAEDSLFDVLNVAKSYCHSKEAARVIQVAPDADGR